MSPLWRIIIRIQCTGSRFPDHRSIIYPLNDTTAVSDFWFCLVGYPFLQPQVLTVRNFSLRCSVFVPSLSIRQTYKGLFPSMYALNAKKVPLAVRNAIQLNQNRTYRQKMNHLRVEGAELLRNRC